MASGRRGSWHRLFRSHQEEGHRGGVPAGFGSPSEGGLARSLELIRQNRAPGLRIVEGLVESEAPMCGIDGRGGSGVGSEVRGARTCRSRPESASDGGGALVNIEGVVGEPRASERGENE
jgi:hypothetical protein